MNGQMNNYNSYMQKNYSPIDVNALPYFVDMKAMRAYAQEKGVSISDLTNSEKKKFTKPNPTSKKASCLQKKFLKNTTRIYPYVIQTKNV